MENIKSNELSLVFSKIVFKELCCDKVWEISIFPSCIPIRGIYRKSLLTSRGRGFTVQFETDHGINALIIFCHFTIIGKVFSFFSSVYLAIDYQFIKIKEGFTPRAAQLYQIFRQ